MLRAGTRRHAGPCAVERAADMLQLAGSAGHLHRTEPAAMVTRSIDGFIDASRRRNLSLRDFAHWLRKAEVREAGCAAGTVLLCTVEAAKGQNSGRDAAYLEAGAFPMAVATAPRRATASTSRSPGARRTHALCPRGSRAGEPFCRGHAGRQAVARGACRSTPSLERRGPAWPCLPGAAPPEAPFGACALVEARRSRRRSRHRVDAPTLIFGVPGSCAYFAVSARCGTWAASVGVGRVRPAAGLAR